jgi:hypothetical protein
MRAAIVQFVVATALVSGCSGLTRQTALPAKHRMQVGQLVFNSNFELPPDHRLVRELTAERGDICRTLGLPCTNEPIEVYLFRDAETYGEFLLQHFPNVPSRRAFFLETDTSLAVYAHWSDRVAEDLRHEVAHGYLHSVAAGIPLWLDEGLAEYFEVPRGHGGLNRPHLELLTDMQRLDQWQPNLENLEKLTEASQMNKRHYAEAWAWVYFLLNSGPDTRDVLTSYMADVSDKGIAEPLSMRLAAQKIGPQPTMVQFLAALNSPEKTSARGNLMQKAK